MTMFFYTFLATPTPEAEEYQDSGGAYVNCWIRGEDGDRQATEDRARKLIEEYGWTVESLEEGSIVTGDAYQEEDEDREFYEEALMEGEVLVFNTWPRDDEEDEDEDDEGVQDDDEALN